MPSRQQQRESDIKVHDDDDGDEHKSSSSSSFRPSFHSIIPSSPVSPSPHFPSVCPSPPQSLSPSHYASGRWYQVGDCRLRWGEKLREMHDSSAHMADPDVLRANLQRDGYILLRSALPTDLVLGARAVVTGALHKHFHCIDASRLPHNAAAILSAPSLSSPTVLLTGYAPVTHHASTLALLESAALASLMRSLFGCAPATFHTKWVRVMARHEYTNEHVDYYRFSGNAQRMLTCWVPLGDYAKDRGVLAVAHRSHRLIEREEDERALRSQRNDEKSDDCKADGDEEAKDKNARELPRAYGAAAGGAMEWHTTDVRVGDVVVFDIRAIHASTTNESDRFRISMDTRWQPAHLTPPSQRNAFKPL